MPLLLVGGLAILLTAFVAYGMAFQTRSFGGGLIGWLGSQIKDTIAAVPWIGSQVIELTKWLAHSIGAHFSQVEGHAVNWLSAFADYLDYTAESIAGIMYDLRDAMHWLVLHEIPKLIHALPNAVSTVTHAITKRVTVIERSVVKLPGLTKAEVKAAVAVAIPGLIAHDLPSFDWLRKHLKALERVIAAGGAGAIAGILDWERGIGGRLDKDIAGIRKRIGKLEKLSAGEIAAGAVAIALAKLGLSWIRCENNKAVGKAICGLPSNLLQDLLGLLTDVLVLTNICTVIPILEQGFEVVEPAIAELTSGAAALLCAGRYPGPPALGVPALKLPASPVGLPALQLP